MMHRMHQIALHEANVCHIYVVKSKHHLRVQRMACKHSTCNNERTNEMYATIIWLHVRCTWSLCSCTTYFDRDAIFAFHRFLIVKTFVLKKSKAKSFQLQFNVEFEFSFAFNLNSNRNYLYQCWATCTKWLRAIDKLIDILN